MHQPLCMYTNRFPPLVFPDRWFQSTWKKQQGVDVEWESGILLFQPGQTCPKYSTVHHLPASGELTRPCCKRSARWPKTVTFQLGQLTNFFFTSFCTLLLFVCTTLCCASPTLPYMLFHTGRDVIKPGYKPQEPGKGAMCFGHLCLSFNTHFLYYTQFLLYLLLVQ